MAALLLLVSSLCAVALLVERGETPAGLGGSPERSPSAPELSPAELVAAGGPAMGAERTARTPRAPVESGSTPEPGLRVRVVDGGGAPVEGVLLLPELPTADPWQDLGPLARDPFAPPMPHRLTGPDGRAVFDELSSTAVALVALPPNHLPVRTLLGPDRSGVEVVLAASVSIAGVVTIDGATPAAPVPVVVSGFVDPTGSWSETARALLVLHERRGDRIEARTEADGTFRLDGVPPGGDVAVEVEGPYRRTGGGAARWILRAEGSFVALELESAPTLVVRLVPGPGGRRGAAVELSARFDLEGGEAARARRDAVLGETVSFGLPVRGAIGAELVARDGEGRTIGRARLGGGELPSGRPLDFVLPETRRDLILLIVDTAGRPLDDARALYDGELQRAAAGEVRLPYAPSRGDLVVGAPRHAARELSVDALDALHWGDPTVQLAEANSLEILVDSGVDPRASGIGIDVVVGWSPSSPAARLRGAPARELGSDGVWRAWDLPAGEPLVLALRDSFGFELRREEVVLPPTGSVRRTIEVHSGPRTLTGRIVDGDGQPVRGARVTLGFRLGPGPRVDGDGRFELRGVFDPRPVLDVAADGFIGRTLRLSDVLVDADHALEAARELRVRILRSGAPGRVESLELELGGRVFRAGEVGPGDYRFDAVPRSPGKLVARNPDAVLAIDATEVHVSLTLDR